MHTAAVTSLVAKQKLGSTVYKYVNNNHGFPKIILIIEKHFRVCKSVLMLPHTAIHGSHNIAEFRTS